LQLLKKGQKLELVGLPLYWIQMEFHLPKLLRNLGHCTLLVNLLLVPSLFLMLRSPASQKEKIEDDFIAADS